MDNTYSSKYSGEQVDAAVEYFLNHSQIEESSSYEYTNTIFCRSNGLPASPFNESSLPTPMPLEFPFAGIDGKLWYDVPNTSTKDWYQCALKINFKSKKVVSQSKVLDMTGATGRDGRDGIDGKDGMNGADGRDGNDGINGNNGKDGNYIEFRYKRVSAYAVTLTNTQKTSRFPEGWVSDLDKASVEDKVSISSKTIDAFCSYLSTFSSIGSIESSDRFFSLSYSATYSHISSLLLELYEVPINANDTQQIEIVKAFKEYKKLYTNTGTNMPELELNMEYHRLYKLYNDADHLWLLFMISAIISGEDNSLIGEWSVPQRIQGEDGKPGPSGSNGIAGIPGVNIGVAFTIGDEDGPRPEAAKPTTYPYNTNYNALFASGTLWGKSTPTVTSAYPYIWFTQCRYRVNTNSSGVQTYEFEDPWSSPARYTGLNGITTTETIHVKNPIIYPQGIYKAGVTYVNDGARAPYVYDNGNYYYLSGQGSWTGTVSSTPANNRAWWTLLEGFEALYTKVGIIANGLIGSAVFNGDYMFSQQGIDQNGDGSSEYENFLKNYSTGGTLTNPYDKMAAFKPNFCINFKTGEQWSTAMNSAISTAKSEVLQLANQISMSVKEQVNGEMRQAGINITSSGVEVTGKFSGTSDGKFTGDVSAKSLTVLGEDNTPAMIFDTYKKVMGTPSGGVAPEVGTPVLLINFKGNQYLVSMLKLVTGSSTGNYKQNQFTTAPLYTTNRISMKQGVQGIDTHHCITAAPYLTLIDNQGIETGTTITAKLYNSSGTTEVNWKDYMNKYYSGTLVSEYPEKTDLGSGIWAFRVTGSFANVTGVYNGTPEIKNLAVVTYCRYNPPDISSSQWKDGYVHTSVSSSIYSKIEIVAGVLRTLPASKKVVGYEVLWKKYFLGIDKSSPTFLKIYHNLITSSYSSFDNSTTESDSFAVPTTSSDAEMTNTEISQCAAILERN